MAAAEAELAQRAQDLNNRNVAVATAQRNRQTELDVAAGALQAREAAVTVREQAVLQKANELNASQAEMDVKMGKLRALL